VNGMVASLDLDRRISGTDFNVSEVRNFARHDLELRQRPAVIKALQVSSDVAERLATEGLAVKFNEPGIVGAPDGARQ
jgi:hypothetical protein